MTKKESIVLIGAGGHGKVIADMIEKAGSYEITGFVDDRKTGKFFGYDILGTSDAIPSLTKKGIMVATVSIGNNEARLKMQDTVTATGMTLATIIHPSAQIARGAMLGEGTVVMPGTVVGPDTQINRGCIINTGATIDHDCTLAAGVHISPGAHLAGGVTVGEATHIGIGSAVKEGIVIGSRVVIGAGSVVVENLPDDCVAYGVPAKPVR